MEAKFNVFGFSIASQGRSGGLAHLWSKETQGGLLSYGPKKLKLHFKVILNITLMQMYNSPTIMKFDVLLLFMGNRMLVCRNSLGTSYDV